MERELFIDNSLDQIHFITVMVWWTGLAPRKFEFPSPGLESTFLDIVTLDRGTKLDALVGGFGLGLEFGMRGDVFT